MTEEKKDTKPRNMWLNSKKLFKVYHSDDRNDGVVVFRNKRVSNKGVSRGQEYDRITLVPFYDAEAGGATRTMWNPKKKNLVRKDKNGKPRRSTRTEYPLVSIERPRARELAKAILDAADEPDLTQEEVKATRKDKAKEKTWEKMWKQGL